MKNKLLVLLFMVVSTVCGAVTQPNLANIRGKPMRDIREFQAPGGSGFVGDGTMDCSFAFASAAAWIKSNGGNCGIYFGPGTYPVLAHGAATPAGFREVWSPFEVRGADNIHIHGEPGASIVGSVNMGSSSSNGQSMHMFNFLNCNHVLIDGLNITVAVTATRNPSDTVPELASAIHAQATDSAQMSNIEIRDCRFSVTNAVNGNGLKQGYEFAQVWIEGDFAPAATDRKLFRDIRIYDCVFSDGQGPTLWLNYVYQFDLSHNAFVDCGGPLPTVRLTLGCSRGTISSNVFQMKHQPGQYSAADHNYPIFSTGRSFATTDNTGDGLTISNNVFNTLGGQALALSGGKNISFCGNTVIRNLSETSYGEAIGMTNSASAGTFLDTVENMTITGNTFDGITTTGAIVAIGSQSGILVSSNVFNNCYRALYAGPEVSIGGFNSNIVSSGSFRQLEFAGNGKITTPTTINGNVFKNNLEQCIYAQYSDKSILNIIGNSFLTNCIAATASPVISSTQGTLNVTGNTFRDNRGSGVDSWAFNSVGGEIIGNNFTGCGREAIIVRGSRQKVIGNNIVNNNQLRLPGIPQLLVASDAKLIFISGNSLYDELSLCAFGIWIASASTSVVESNMLYNACAATGTWLATGTSGVVTRDNEH